MTAPRNAQRGNRHTKVPRICHLSDVHLGYRRYYRLTKQGFNQREVDICYAFREAIDQIIALKPDLVLIAGDLFHVVRPSNAVLWFAFREIGKLARDAAIPVVIIGGNHETPKRSDSGSALRLFREIPHVYVAEGQAQQWGIPELSLGITAYPHGALPPTQPLRRQQDYHWNVLITHAQIGSRSESDQGGIRLPLSALALEEWDYVALGHEHRRTKIAHNCYYSGAIEYTENNLWQGAGEERGFLEVSLNGPEVTFHPLSTRREVVVCPPVYAAQLTPNEVMESIRDRFTETPQGISGKIVRLQVQDIVPSVYKLLPHKEIQAFKREALHLSLEFSFLHIERRGEEEVKTPSHGLIVDMKNFLQDRISSNERRDKVAQVIDHALSLVTRKYETKEA